MANLERLRELAEVVLPNVPDENFDLSAWQCGSAACAVGWACQHPPFIEQGLGLEPIGCKASESDFYPVLLKADSRLESWSAVSQFFGLNFLECDRLFYVYSYEDEYTKQDVIDRILEFVREGQADD